MLETAEVTLKSFLENAHSPSTALFFGGKAGTGKTTLGVGVGRECEEKGKKVVFIQTSQLLKLFALSGDTGKAKLLSHDVFILDDFNGATGGMESGFLRWIVPELHSKSGKLLIVTSNMPYDNFYQIIVNSFNNNFTQNDGERLKRRINELFTGRTFFIEN